jgi:hypothetical protein
MGIVALAERRVARLCAAEPRDPAGCLIDARWRNGKHARVRSHLPMIIRFAALATEPGA